jgi:hypothetical protein
MSTGRLPFELDIISTPLRLVFQTRTLRATLNVLPMLVIRFDLTYKNIVEDLDWKGQFHTVLALFNALMAGHSMRQLAKEVAEWTSTNLTIFALWASKPKTLF